MIWSHVRSPQILLTVAATVFAAAWGLFLGLWHLDGRASPLDRLEAPLVDLRFVLTGPVPPPSNVVIVAIDDATVRDIGRYPLPRARLAQLVRAIAKAEPKAIALDLLLIDAGNAESDADLGNALRQNRAVIAAAGLFSRDQASEAKQRVLADVPQVEQMIWPIEPFRSAAALGLVNIATDHAGIPRHVPLILRAEGSIWPSLPLRVATLAARKDPAFGDDKVTIGGVSSSTDIGFYLPIRFYGPRGTIPTVSAGDVLQGVMLPVTLKDKIVIVGATAIGTSDVFATPFDPVLPGVEVLATAISHLTNGNGLQRTVWHRRADALAAIVLPVVAVLMIGLRRISVALLALGAVTLFWIGLTVVAFAYGAWLSATIPLAAVIPTAIAYVIGRLWLDQKTERELAATQVELRRFQPPALTESLSGPDFLSRPMQQHAAVMFVDLSGFTGMSERLGPERTRDLLRELHTLIEEEVYRFKGLVLNYMGDGAMIVFGLPEASDADAGHAVEAARALADRVSHWITDLPTDASEKVGVRVGAHYGPVVVSKLGTDAYQHVTATGDSVNVASRLLEVARLHHARIVLSADLFQAAGEPALPNVSPEREVTIRGRKNPLNVRLLSV